MSDKSEQEKRFEELNMEHAMRAHDINRQTSAEATRAAIESANLAIRSLIIINGGAVVALLAFLGALESGDAGNTIKATALVTPIYWFALGVGLSAFTAMCAYLVNMSDADLNNNVAFTWDYPYVVPQKYQKARSFFRQIFFWFGIGSATAAMISFLMGIQSVTDAISRLQI